MNTIANDVHTKAHLACGRRLEWHARSSNGTWPFAVLHFVCVKLCAPFVLNSKSTKFVELNRIVGRMNFPFIYQSIYISKSRSFVNFTYIHRHSHTHTHTRTHTYAHIRWVTVFLPGLSFTSQREISKWMRIFFAANAHRKLNRRIYHSTRRYTLQQQHQQQQPY